MLQQELDNLNQEEERLERRRGKEKVKEKEKEIRRDQKEEHSSVFCG